MDLDGQENTDEFIITAERIFEFCGEDISNTICVDTLMDKFAPFVKTNKAEYSYLKSLLDPDQCNPDITVTELAASLGKYSESQKVKADLEESFNLKSGLVPHDSDSGISTDGFQLLEELQCELREKAQMTQQLRLQLDDCDAQHEEALAAAAAEANALREHLNLLREENLALSHVRRDYDDVCEQYSNSERALTDARGLLEGAKRRARVLTEQVTLLENEKLTLQELLSSSKAECHRINEMYAARQYALLEQNETLRSERAELAARAHDLDRDLQQLAREKVLIEMELKDMLNRSNTNLRMERSIDISYTDDQVLTALDSLNADSKFTQENRLLDEESFVKALKDDHGRPTNLFDEIRLSFCNTSRNNFTELNHSQTFEKRSEMDNSFITVGTQTEFNNCGSLSENDNYVSTAVQTDIEPYRYNDKGDFNLHPSDINLYNSVTVSTQTIPIYNNNALNQSQIRVKNKNKSKSTALNALKVFRDIKVVNFGTQTDSNDFGPNDNNNNVQTCIDCAKCVECDRLNKYANKLEGELIKSNIIVEDMQIELSMYEENLNMVKSYVDEGNERNNALKAVLDSVKDKLNVLETSCMDQNSKIEAMRCDVCSAEIQTECEQSSVSTQTDLACTDCVRRASHRGLRRYLWHSLKWLFQVFAVVCFACAVWALCGVTRRQRGCHPSAWWWLHAHELLDLLLTIEHVAEVPM